MVMLLSSVVLAALAVTFTSSMRAARASSARVSTTADARIGMDAMLRRLRVAVIPPGKSSAFDMSGMAAGTNYPVGVTVPSATEVAFFTSVTTGGSTADPAPTLVDYSIDTTANCLRERMTAASGAVRATPGRRPARAAAVCSSASSTPTAARCSPTSPTASS